jgi:Fur family peroxide stress response transcriptional regulator
MKYSRQRECIREFLSGRQDHPTAETVYTNVKKEFPNISLGTVYRNLALLTEVGEIQKISTGIGPDRFDWNTAPHYHVLCRGCGSVMDLMLENINHINILAGNEFDGRIEGHIAYFLGTCKACLGKESKEANPQEEETADNLEHKAKTEKS